MQSLETGSHVYGQPPCCSMTGQNARLEASQIGPFPAKVMIGSAWTVFYAESPFECLIVPV